MKTDMPPAALRLMATCPVHIHERKQPERAPNLGNRALNRGRGITVIFGKGGKARPVKIGGRTYPSATDAARTLRKSTAKIYEWLRSGEAQYVP